MTVLKEIKNELSGYKLHVIPTEKYKTNTIVWKMKTPLNSDNVTLRALLPYVLQNSSEKHNTTSKLRSYLDELYGASLYVDLAKKGNYHIVTFTIEVANEKFLKDNTPLLKKGLQLLKEILLAPNLENNCFSKQVLENEKRVLKQRIEAQYDDKMRYANIRLVEEMCKGEKYEINPFGYLNKIDEITSEQLYNYYKQAFAEDELDLYIIGDVNEEEVRELAEDLLQFEDRIVEKSSNCKVEEGSSFKVIKEEQDVLQGKLNIGYRTNTYYGDDDYYALQVFNGLFGGFPHSKLFLNVREKESLAYYAASRLESHKGLLIVMSGIEIENYDRAVNIINEQIEEMRQGNFSAEELAQTKAVIKNQMLETVDSARGIIELFYHNVIKDVNISVDDWLEKIDKVTEDEIVTVSKKIKPDTIYFLTGMEANK